MSIIYVNSLSVNILEGSSNTILMFFIELAESKIKAKVTISWASIPPAPRVPDIAGTGGQGALPGGIPI